MFEYQALHDVDCFGAIQAEVADEAQGGAKHIPFTESLSAGKKGDDGRMLARREEVATFLDRPGLD